MYDDDDDDDVHSDGDDDDVHGNGDDVMEDFYVFDFKNANYPPEIRC